MKKAIILILFFGCILSVQAQENAVQTQEAEEKTTDLIVPEEVKSKELVGLKKLKHNDQVLPRFFIDLNYKYGLLFQDFEVIDLASQYTNSIAANTKFGEYSFKDGRSHGGDFQIGVFIGKGRRFGIATGVNYFMQSGTIVMDDPMHVEYQSTDSKGRIFRQHITSASTIEEEFSFTNINIPLMLKLKHQFRNSRLGFNIDGGGFINVSNKNKYKSNSNFDYEAIYKLDNNGNVSGYDNSPTPNINSWLITKDFYNNTTPKADNNINDFFNNKAAEGYNVGLAKGATTTNREGTSSFSDMSYGAIAQLSLTYYLTYNVTFNVGGYYMYQLWNNSNDNNYRITDKVGDYNSMLNSITKSTATSYGMTVGFRFFFGEKRDLDWDQIPDKEDKCVDRYGLLVNNGCPDTDEDGIVDDLDDCIDVPGSETANGCPDRDGDGFRDSKDECPDVPGQYQGCPLDKIAEDYLAQKQPEIKEKPRVHYDVLSTDVLYFAFNEATIDEGSYAVLDAAVEALRKNDKVVLFISGYTDSIGNYAANMKLSFDRAKAVSNYIMSKGISEQRVIISGYGKTNPKFPNDTEEERAKNRRIEMKLLLPVEAIND